MDNVRIAEIYRKYLKSDYNNNLKKCIEAGDYILFNADTIKRTFNFNNGTMKDLKRFMNDNRCYCIYVDLNTMEKF